jgi:hypothetical protein
MNANQTWKTAYFAAVCETDDAKMMVRIFEARAAIERRLLCPIEQGSVEHGELLAAQKALEILKSERVDKTDRLHTQVGSTSSQSTAEA